MKIVFYTTVFLLVALFSANAAPVSVSAESTTYFYENLIPNGSFEDDTLTWIYAWGEANANFSIDNDSSLNGEGSLMIEVVNPSTTGVWWDAGIKNSFEINVEEGQAYVFSFISKALADRKMHFDVKVGETKLVDKAIDLTTNSKKYDFGFTASVSGKVTIQFMPTIAGATVYIDDLSFVKLSENQIPNPNFEEDALSWTYAWGEANANFSIDKNSSVNGEGALMIEVVNPSTAGSWWDAGIKNSFPVYVEKGSTYVFSFVSKAAEARKMHFDVKVGETKLVDKAIDLTTDAKKFDFGFTASVSGMITIDDLSFIKLNNNQIPNTNFEEDSLSWIYAWGAANATFSIDKDSSLNGEGSLMIEVVNPSTTGSWWDAGIKNSFPVYVEKGANYVFSFVSKAAEARLMHFDVKVGETKLVDKAIDLTTDAKKFDFGFKASVSGMITIQFMPTIAGATVYVDDISFVKLDANQIPNGTFEADNLAWIYAWGAANASFSIDKNTALNGKGSLMIEVVNPSTAGSWWDAGIKNSFPVYVEKGLKYEFKFDAKAAEARKMHFDVKVGETKLADKAIDLTSAKQAFTFPFISGVTGMVTIQWMPTIAGATVYVDNVSFTEAEIVLVKTIVVTGTDNATSIDKMGGKLQMVATINPENADTKNVTWSVIKGTGEATISDKGLLTAIKNGTVTVKATATDGSLIEGETTITITGQETSVDIVSSSIKIYPNPVENLLNVTSNNPINSVEIISCDGKRLRSFKANSTSVNIPVENLDPGIYMVKIFGKNNHFSMSKFIKK
jgi:hypothetical protein